MKFCRQWRLAVAALSMAIVVNVASADRVSYGFTVVLGPGPLPGATFSGELTFDSALIPPGGGDVTGPNLLTDLNFQWIGGAYDETTANTGSLSFAANGNLLSANFGINCFFTNTCGSAVSNWFVAGSQFLYSVQNSSVIYTGEVTYTPRHGSQPERCRLGLGLATPLAAQRRARKAVPAPAPTRAELRWPMLPHARG